MDGANVGHSHSNGALAGVNTHIGVVWLEKKCRNVIVEVGIVQVDSIHWRGAWGGEMFLLGAMTMMKIVQAYLLLLHEL